MKTRIPKHVEGFTKDIPYYMALSDFFIGKPGPGSISEALSKRLPVIIDCNAWTLPQERYNAEWVLEKQVGIVVKSHRQIASAVAQLLQPGQLSRFKEHAAAMNNRAIFEIPKIFEKILSNASATV
jgi:1,2-diacylglycerol 3-beta-galactosyltransferase